MYDSFFYHRLIFNERFENGKHIRNVHLETFILGLRKTTTIIHVE